MCHSLPRDIIDEEIDKEIRRHLQSESDRLLRIIMKIPDPSLYEAKVKCLITKKEGEKDEE